MFVTAVSGWLFVTIWVTHDSATYSPLLAVVGSVGATGALLALKMTRRSWTFSFALAALIGLALPFGIFLIALSVY